MEEIEKERVYNAIYGWFSEWQCCYFLEESIPCAIEKQSLVFNFLNFLKIIESSATYAECEPPNAECRY